MERSLACHVVTLARVTCSLVFIYLYSRNCMLPLFQGRDVYTCDIGVVTCACGYESAGSNLKAGVDRTYFTQLFRCHKSGKVSAQVLGSKAMQCEEYLGTP